MELFGLSHNSNAQKIQAPSHYISLKNLDKLVLLIALNLASKWNNCAGKIIQNCIGANQQQQL